MIKKLLFITCVLLKTSPLCADFFAFQKLIHPKTGKIIYLLYDAHGTKNANPEGAKVLYQQIMEKINKFRTLFKKGLYSEDLSNEIINNTTKYREQFFPNLIKQQNDLTDIVKTYSISLVNEDWYQYHSATLLHPKHYYPRFVLGGKPRNYPDEVQPMSGIGEKLTGEFKQNVLQPIEKTTAYYYNADHRSGSYTSESNRKLEANTIKAIDELFTTYNQNSVIVAEGADHLRHILPQLVQQGYIAEKPIISDALQKKSNELSYLKALLKYKFENDETDINKLSDDEINAQKSVANHALIDYPINLKEIFAKEFEKESQKKIDTFARALSSITSKKL